MASDPVKDLADEPVDHRFKGLPRTPTRPASP